MALARVYPPRAAYKFVRTRIPASWPREGPIYRRLPWPGTAETMLCTGIHVDTIVDDPGTRITNRGLALPRSVRSTEPRKPADARRRLVHSRQLFSISGRPCSRIGAAISNDLCSTPLPAPPPHPDARRTGTETAFELHFAS